MAPRPIDSELRKLGTTPIMPNLHFLYFRVDNFLTLGAVKYAESGSELADCNNNQLVVFLFVQKSIPLRFYASRLPTFRLRR